MNHYDLETDDMKLTLGSNRHNTLMEKTYPRVSPTDVPVMRCFFFFFDATNGATPSFSDDQI